MSHDMRPLDFMPLGTKGPPDNRRDVWLWWPIRVKWVARDHNDKPRLLRGFTQHGWERNSEIEPLGIEGHALMLVRSARFYVRCWNVGPLCITFGDRND